MKRHLFAMMVFLCVLGLWQVQAVADEFLTLGSSFEEVLNLEGNDYTKTDYSITYAGKEKLGEKCSITYNFKNGVVDSYFIFFNGAYDSDYLWFYDKLTESITDDCGLPKGNVSNAVHKDDSFNENVRIYGNYYATIWDFYEYDDSVLILLISGNDKGEALIGASIEHDPTK